MMINVSLSNIIWMLNFMHYDAATDMVHTLGLENELVWCDLCTAYRIKYHDTTHKS